MIEFMVIAAPRSGTTWAANWLTTDTTLCLHDPLYRWHYLQLDRIESRRTLGISCTGSYFFADWLNAHPARKVILHRDAGEINRDLEAIGLPSMGGDCYSGPLWSIHGRHHDWQDLFHKPAEIYEFLLEQPFDKERHDLLVQMHIQPDFGRIEVDREATAKLAAEVREIVGAQEIGG